jgi:hypothetical protein
LSSSVSQSGTTARYESTIAAREQDDQGRVHIGSKVGEGG